MPPQSPEYLPRRVLHKSCWDSMLIISSFLKIRIHHDSGDSGVATGYSSLTVYSLPLRNTAPANIAVEYYKELTQVKGTFNHSSIYRGDPSPEIDDAWESVSTAVMMPTRITREKLLKIGKEDRPSTVKYREDDGGGYMATLEVTRSTSLSDYYSQVDEFFGKSKPKTHCIDNLRQYMMCQADTAIITFRGFSSEYPDFNTKHQCRKFEKVIAWQKDRGVHVPASHVQRLEAEVDMPYPP
ncbi:hypothetical protein CPB84DRAFT_1783550 [Gymnopilus junonius]|uniref:Uncharacterized protein n=1 Tax=Gymnopilus junonius TaxID=109634 RepID=A0A9P5TM65_GYMJU|nr:hypothetical protein CPB84DRAFT_1783550 [Gymnopilus junonius]